MALERTLFLVKPDGMQRGLAGALIGRLEQRGLRIAGMKLMQISRELASRHYGEHEGKPFYNGLIDYITACPVIAVVWEGTNAITAVRQTMGATNPVKAETGTIRADFALELGRNLVHGSDGEASAAREIALFFPEGVLDTSREIDRWVFEKVD